MLILVNGAPGAGKSTLARRYADDHPLALIVEVDELRRHLGRWRSAEKSKLVARELALALVRAHLATGYDVLVPQLVARPEFRVQLARVAADAGEPFVEVVLTDAVEAMIERFAGRRREHALRGVEHPEADLADEAIGAEIAAIDERLRGDAVARAVPVIAVGAGLDAAYASLVRALRA